MTLNWNPLKRNCLHQKPLLTQGLVDSTEERNLELVYVRLQELEDNSKKLHKEVKHYEDCLKELNSLEDKLASDLCNSAICKESPELNQLCENYTTVVYQMRHSTEDLTDLTQRTVVEPMKKLCGEFPNIQDAIKKRDQTLQEVQRNQQKFEKQSKLEKTGPNIVKTDQMRKAFLHSKEDFGKQNRLLLLELPQFYEKRVEYFQPCLQALIRSQVEYFGESTRLFTSLIPGTTDSSTEADKERDKKLQRIKSLSIVGCQ